MGTGRIGSEEVIEQLPSSLRRLVTFERFHLHRPEVYQNVDEDPRFDTRYFPQNCGALRLPCYWVRRRHLHVYGSPQPSENALCLFEGPGLDDRVLLPVHPLSVDRYRHFLASVGAENAAQDGLCIWAVPTSSTRTLLAWPHESPEHASFLKTSLHSPVLGDRRLYLDNVARSVGLSRLMADCRASLPGSFGFFPETVGIVPRRMPDSGVLLRSIPPEIVDGRAIVAPLFAMLGASGGRVPLFLTVLERSGMEPAEFLEGVLCARFARMWLEMAMELGFALEAHAQDLLLELSPDLTPLRRFLYRDFEGLHVDWELRQRRGLQPARDMPRACAWRKAYGGWDYRFGELAWYKLRISLFGYLHFVINELDLSLRQWQARGLIGGRKWAEDDATMLFSRHMMHAVEEMFGVRIDASYNIFRSIDRFIIVLMNVRKRVLGADIARLRFR